MADPIHVWHIGNLRNVCAKLMKIEELRQIFENWAPACYIAWAPLLTELHLYNDSYLLTYYLHGYELALRACNSLIADNYKLVLSYSFNHCLWIAELHIFSCAVHTDTIQILHSFSVAGPFLWNSLPVQLTCLAFAEVTAYLWRLMCCELIHFLAYLVWNFYTKISWLNRDQK